MVQKVVNYKVKDGAVDAAVSALKEFVEGIRSNEPQTNYHVYQVESDRTRFMHIASFADETSEQKHHNAQYTQKFLQELRTLCEAKPAAADIETVADTKGDGVVDWAND